MADGERVRPLCFVLMPFGTKQDPSGLTVRFDAAYSELIAPAIRDAELEPIRADQEMTGGIIHKPMFERLLLCEYAVADLTLANANVLYELGVRHAVRPWSTVLILAQGGRLPFDVALARALPYRLDPSGLPIDVDSTRKELAERLRAAREAATDSPVFQLVDQYPPPDLQRLKTDVFRERARYSEEVKSRLAAARKAGKAGAAAVRALEGELGPIEDVEAGILIDLLLSYRAVEAFQEMVSLAERMPEPLAATPMVQEQLGFALNRLGRRSEAERVLTSLIERRGPSSETYGLLGRVYKDLWDDAVKAGDDLLARGHLDRAIDAYVKGFEADWRDAYPGINAVTLMEIHEPPDPRREKLLPVVTYDVERRIATGRPDYWDYATLLEASVLGDDEAASIDALTKALAVVREQWEPSSTANNLRLIREARARRGESRPWADRIEAALERRADELAREGG
jgi:tetratricopeptide (TPR) repeat protein